ncbi:DUF2889 domain-containing protein [Solimicrobium silvestre]|uniref:DUF2889 domain-containing protein n=1 Tax=Solimicrobium silvestre TaxID=2099400 RepID=A0A2S9GTG5_9BURK|nr:DUF2889 domain-containing protein [Solimicrobium silvestre]PRC91007.1 hypothetical protein S2091_4303 [Solimicrobium silvestre]
MFFSPPNSRRALKHSRVIEIDAYAREDSLWDIEARIRDTKTSDTQLASGLRPAGMPIHDLGLRICINTQFDIVDAEAVSSAHPYPGYCNAITPDYTKLVGLNLLKQFRHEVKVRLGGTRGCTHLTELAQVLPTAALQAFAGEVLKTHEVGGGEVKNAINATVQDNQQQPFQLDRCHALKLDSGAVATYYPRWVKQASA